MQSQTFLIEYTETGIIPKITLMYSFAVSELPRNDSVVSVKIKHGLVQFEQLAVNLS
jgi:hypothetical protein